MGGFQNKKSSHFTDSSSLGRTANPISWQSLGITNCFSFISEKAVVRMSNEIEFSSASRNSYLLNCQFFLSEIFVGPDSLRDLTGLKKSTVKAYMFAPFGKTVVDDR